MHMDTYALTGYCDGGMLTSAFFTSVLAQPSGSGGTPIVVPD